MSSVTQDIDAIATTRVVIGGDSSITAKHTLHGVTFDRTFRSNFLFIDDLFSKHSHFFYVLVKKMQNIDSSHMNKISKEIFLLSFHGTSVDQIFSSTTQKPFYSISLPK
jgi:hypothetical protein